MPDQLPTDSPMDPGPWEGWPWSLHDLVSQATWATNVHRPVTVIRHFQLEQPPPHDMPTAAA